MENQNWEITYLDIKEYWLTLFREFDSMDELDKLLEEVSRIKEDKVETFILNYSNKINEEEYKKLFTIEMSARLCNLVKKLKRKNPFINFFVPFLNYYFNELNNMIESSTFIEDKDEFLSCFLENEYLNLLEFSQRTLVLEVNCARINGLLKGNTSEERFNYYIDYLLKDNNYLRTVYDEYNHLSNLLILRCRWDFQFVCTVISRIEENIYEIKSEILDTDNDIKIKSISLGLGDSHNKGKTVSIISFSDDSKIVYKPRTMELELGFNKYLEFLNSKSEDRNCYLYTMKVISHEDYGFCEFVKHEECKSLEEAKNFYYKTGKLLAALYSLNAKDIHHENIIARGLEPIVIDLEALFHSDITLIDKKFFKSIEVAQKIIDSSVYSIGFLPQKISNPFETESSKYVDISAFGGEENQLAPFKAFKVINGNTDEIKIEKVDGFIEMQSNNPKVNGKVVKSEDYVEEIKRGFSDVYEVIANNKIESEITIRNIFSSMKNRFILRPTYIYGQLIHTSYHPDFMRNEMHRYILLHRLGVNVDKEFLNVVSSEIDDILQGDVPYFYSYIDSNEIRNSKGNKIDITLDGVPLEKVLNKIDNFGDDDKKRQLHFIDMSFLAKTTNGDKDDTNIEFSSKVHENKINRDTILNLAEKIGDYILDKSIEGYYDGRFDRTWIGTVLIGRDECNWALAPVGNSLYEGNTGIALFLAYLGYELGDDKYIKVALEALESSIHEIEVLNPKYPFLIGPYNGVSGYFYVIYQVYKITKNERYLNILKNKLPILLKLVCHDKNLDVISGVGGTIGVMLSIYNDTDDYQLKNITLDICKLCLQHLKNNKVKFFGNSIGWGSGGVYEPCTGFAHGNAGIISYLIKLYKVVEDEEILELVKEALNYERGLYSKENKNWYSSVNNKRCSVAWCHGAPGILLSRIILKENGYNDELIDEEIKIALDTTINKGIGNNPCFCHGDLGNLSIIRYAAKVLDNKELYEKCDATFAELFNKVLSVRWNKGVFSGTESMGLMIGLGCFGYGLLKEIDNEKVPEILWF